jgi:hypothetical protein
LPAKAAHQAIPKKTHRVIVAQHLLEPAHITYLRRIHYAIAVLNVAKIMGIRLLLRLLPGVMAGATPFLAVNVMLLGQVPQWLAMGR